MLEVHPQSTPDLQGGLTKKTFTARRTATMPCTYVVSKPHGLPKNREEQKVYSTQNRISRHASKSAGTQLLGRDRVVSRVWRRGEAGAAEYVRRCGLVRT